MMIECARPTPAPPRGGRDVSKMERWAPGAAGVCRFFVPIEIPVSRTFFLFNLLWVTRKNRFGNRSASEAKFSHSRLLVKTAAVIYRCNNFWLVKSRFEICVESFQMTPNAFNFDVRVTNNIDFTGISFLNLAETIMHTALDFLPFSQEQYYLTFKVSSLSDWWEL